VQFTTYQDEGDVGGEVLLVVQTPGGTVNYTLSKGAACNLGISLITAAGGIEKVLKPRDSVPAGCPECDSKENP
jgi:hypothetical protein